MNTPTVKIFQTPKPASEKKWLVPLLLGLIGLLLLSNLYVINLYVKTEKQSTDEVNKLTESSLLLNKTYEDALDSLNRQKTENTELNDYVEEMKQGLTRVYEEIGMKIKEGMSNDELNGELDRLTAQMRSSIQEIKALRDDKIALQRRLDQIRGEKVIETGRRKMAENQRDSISFVAVENESRAKQAEEIAAANKKEADEKITAYERQIAEASYIGVPKVVMTAQIQKKKKSERTEKAHKADYYQICFTTQVNPLANKGKQVFYLRVLLERGEPLQIGDEETTANGKPVRFVKSVNVDYEGTSKESCFKWEPTDKLKPGKYNIEVYHNQKLVGQSDLVLK